MHETKESMKRARGMRAVGLKDLTVHQVQKEGVLGVSKGLKIRVSKTLAANAHRGTCGGKKEQGKETSHYGTEEKKVPNCPTPRLPCADRGAKETAQ